MSELCLRRTYSSLTFMLSLLFICTQLGGVTSSALHTPSSNTVYQPPSTLPSSHTFVYESYDEDDDVKTVFIPSRDTLKKYEQFETTQLKEKQQKQQQQLSQAQNQSKLLQRRVATSKGKQHSHIQNSKNYEDVAYFVSLRPTHPLSFQGYTNTFMTSSSAPAPATITTTTTAAPSTRSQPTVVIIPEKDIAHSSSGNDGESTVSFSSRSKFMKQSMRSDLINSKWLKDDTTSSGARNSMSFLHNFPRYQTGNQLGQVHSDGEAIRTYIIGMAFMIGVPLGCAVLSWFVWLTFCMTRCWCNCCGRHATRLYTSRQVNCCRFSVVVMIVTLGVACAYGWTGNIGVSTGLDSAFAASDVFVNYCYEYIGVVSSAYSVGYDARVVAKSLNDTLYIIPSNDTIYNYHVPCINNINPYNSKEDTFVRAVNDTTYYLYYAYNSNSTNSTSSNLNNTNSQLVLNTTIQELPLLEETRRTVLTSYSSNILNLNPTTTTVNNVISYNANNYVVTTNNNNQISQVTLFHNELMNLNYYFSYIGNVSGTSDILYNLNNTFPVYYTSYLLPMEAATSATSSPPSAVAANLTFVQSTALPYFLPVFKQYNLALANPPNFDYTLAKINGSNTTTNTELASLLVNIQGFVTAGLPNLTILANNLGIWINFLPSFNSTIYDLSSRLIDFQTYTNTRFFTHNSSVNLNTHLHDLTSSLWMLQALCNQTSNSYTSINYYWNAATSTAINTSATSNIFAPIYRDVVTFSSLLNTYHPTRGVIASASNLTAISTHLNATRAVVQSYYDALYASSAGTTAATTSILAALSLFNSTTLPSIMCLYDTITLLTSVNNSIVLLPNATNDYISVLQPIYTNNIRNNLTSIYNSINYLYYSFYNNSLSPSATTSSSSSSSSPLTSLTGLSSTLSTLSSLSSALLTLSNTLAVDPFYNDGSAAGHVADNQQALLEQLSRVEQSVLSLDLNQLNNLLRSHLNLTQHFNSLNTHLNTLALAVNATYRLLNDPTLNYNVTQTAVLTSIYQNSLGQLASNVQSLLSPLSASINEASSGSTTVPNYVLTEPNRSNVYNALVVLARNFMANTSTAVSLNTNNRAGNILSFFAQLNTTTYTLPSALSVFHGDVVDVMTDVSPSMSGGYPYLLDYYNTNFAQRLNTLATALANNTVFTQLTTTSPALSNRYIVLNLEDSLNGLNNLNQTTATLQTLVDALLSTSNSTNSSTSGNTTSSSGGSGTNTTTTFQTMLSTLTALNQSLPLPPISYVAQQTTITLLTTLNSVKNKEMPDLGVQLSSIDGVLNTVSSVLDWMTRKRQSYNKDRNNFKYLLDNYDGVRLLIFNLFVLGPFVLSFLGLYSACRHDGCSSMCMGLTFFPFFSLMMFMSAIQMPISVFLADFCYNSTGTLKIQSEGRTFNKSTFDFFNLTNDLDVSQMVDYFAFCEGSPPEFMGKLAQPKQILNSRGLNFTNIYANIQSDVSASNLTLSDNFINQYNNIFIVEQDYVSLFNTTLLKMNCTRTSMIYQTLLSSSCTDFGPYFGLTTIVFLFIGCCLAPSICVGIVSYKRFNPNNRLTTSTHPEPRNEDDVEMYQRKSTRGWEDDD